MCDLQWVRRLSVANLQVCDWTLFRNLRSLSFYKNNNQTDNNLLTQICTYCPQIVNLEVANGGMVTGEIVVPAIQRLTNLRSLCVDYQMGLDDHLVRALVECHQNALEGVYLLEAHTISANSVNILLTQCGKLRTLSYTAQEGIDYGLMSSLTTIVTDLPGPEEWCAICKHCRRLQHLHFILPRQRSGVPYGHIVKGKHDLPALRTVYTAQGVGPLQHHITQALRLQLPPVRVVQGIVGEWHKLGEWYKLFDLPI